MGHRKSYQYPMSVLLMDEYIRYFPDYLIEVRDTQGKTSKQLIEVKPKKQTQPPVKPQSVTKSFLYEAAMWMKNQLKWKELTEFCLDNGVQFRIITEDELGIKQYDSRFHWI